MNEVTGYRKLNEAFQYISDEFLDLVEDEKERVRSGGIDGDRIKKKPGWRMIMPIAACLCFLLLPLGVIAAKQFGLRDLLLPDEDSGPPPISLSGDRESAEASAGNTDNTENMAFISLSGYRNSPESQALAEWNTFLSCYDTDHQIADTQGDDVFLAEGREDWSLYNVRSREMGEELDRIAGHYGLKLHSVINVIDQEELMYRVGGSFADPDCLTWAYMYEDGYFFVEGTAELEDGTADFQLVRVVKGTFNEIMLGIGSVDRYTEWQYLSSGGDSLLLALGEEKGLIFAESEDCFIAVNVLGGSRTGMSREGMQELADRIDFGILKDVRQPDMRGDSPGE